MATVGLWLFYSGLAVMGADIIFAVILAWDSMYEWKYSWSGFAIYSILFIGTALSFTGMGLMIHSAT